MPHFEDRPIKATIRCGEIVMDLNVSRDGKSDDLSIAAAIGAFFGCLVAAVVLFVLSSCMQ